MNAQPASRSTVDKSEVARFSALADTWWDFHGKMGVLHKFNPVRLGFIKDAVCRRFDRDAKRLDSLNGLRMLDIGLRRRPVERAFGPPRRWRRWSRPGGSQYRGGQTPCRGGRPGDRLSCHHGRSPGGCGRALRRGARHGGGRARCRSQPVSSGGAARWSIRAG